MTEVTRGEFDLLKQIVSEQGARQIAMDDHGTRGLGILQQQITEATKDLTELKTETVNWQALHTRQHEEVQQQRREARRWVFGFAVTGLASLAGIGALLFEILQSLH